MSRKLIVVAENLLFGRISGTMAEIRFKYLKRDTLTSQWYYTDVLQGHIRLFRSAISPELLLMDNNIRPHAIAEVFLTLAGDGIGCRTWPA